ncbi:GNAT family N-acetyltransferase [Chitinibacteraceae bacterium HSL-7]
MSEIEFSFDLTTMDWPRVTRWLASSYWSPGISEHFVRQGAAASTVVIGAFVAGQQVAYARAVSDTVRFCYLADVFVDERWRGQGVAKELLDALMAHPKIRHVVSCYLLTATPEVYHGRGFEAYPTPERFMIRRNPDALDFNLDGIAVPAEE